MLTGFDREVKSFLDNRIKSWDLGKISFSFQSSLSLLLLLFLILVRTPHHWDRPNNLSALNAVAKPTSSGFLFMNAAIISTIAGKLHGSLRWKVQ